jgi:hypothetical protein
MSQDTIARFRAAQQRVLECHASLFRRLALTEPGVLPVPCSPDHCPTATGPADEPECRCAQENEQ